MDTGLTNRFPQHLSVSTCERALLASIPYILARSLQPSNWAELPFTCSSGLLYNSSTLALPVSWPRPRLLSPLLTWPNPDRLCPLQSLTGVCVSDYTHPLIYSKPPAPQLEAAMSFLFLFLFHSTQSCENSTEETNIAFTQHTQMAESSTQL